MYIATATLENGETFTITGSIMQCANWAEIIIRSSSGNVNIEIKQVEV